MNDIAANGYVYETFGISKRFPIKLQLLLIRAETLDKPLTAKCFIHDVCALHEQCTHHRRSVKMSKIQIFFKIPIVRGYIFFPEGANPLCVPIYRESISKSQAGCW